MFPSFLTVGLWAFTVVAANRAARLVGGAAANLGRLALALVFLALWAHIFGKGLQGESFRWFVLSGCVGFGIGDVAAFEALPRIGPRMTSLSVMCLSVPIAAFIEWTWLGTRLTHAQMLWAGVILVGVVVAVAPKEHLHLGRQGMIAGALAGFLAGFGQGLGAVLSRKAYQIAGNSIDGGTAAYQRALGGIVIIAAVLAFTTLKESAPKRNWRAGWKWIVAHALTERMELYRPLSLAEPELHAPAREEIERRHALGHANRVVGGELHDAVAEPDALRALARGAEKDFRRRAMGVLLEEVVLDAPRVVEAEPIGELDLRERVLEELVLATFRPRSGKLELVEDPEFHAVAAYRKWAGC